MIKLFQEKKIEQEFNENDARIKRAIDAIHENHLSSSSVQTMLEGIVASHQISVPKLEFDKMENSTSLQERDIRTFPPDVAMFSSTRTIPVAVVTYTIPFSGSKDLLMCLPTKTTGKTWLADVKNQTLAFDVWT